MESNFEQIKMLNLTEDDFKLLVDGLDSLPEKGLAGELVGGLFEAMLSDKSPEAAEKMKKERDIKRRAEEKNKDIMKENIRILQGKLLMLKRYFQENKLLKDAYEVLDIPKQ